MTGLRSLARAALALCVTLFTTASAAGPVASFTYTNGKDKLSFTPPATFQAIVHPGNQTCQYQAGRGDELLRDLLDPDVQAAMRAHTVARGEAGRFQMGNDSIEWSPQAPEGSTVLRVFHLRLRVELIKAEVRCVARHEA